MNNEMLSEVMGKNESEQAVGNRESMNWGERATQDCVISDLQHEN